MTQLSSTDVHLDRLLRLSNNYKYPVTDPAADRPELMRFVDASAEGSLILHLGEFVLGSTYEKVTLVGDAAACLEGKSSLGRLGLFTHSTAGFIDPGFSGHVTLELSNTAMLPIAPYLGMKVGQLCFFQLLSVAEKSYGSGASGLRYQGQHGPTAPRFHLNFHRIDVGETPAE